MNESLYNQNFFNKLTKEEQNLWINKVFNYYNKSLPLVKYDKKKILKHFNSLKNNQSFKKINDYEYIDVDYKFNYVNLCILSDFYQNKIRMNCYVNKYLKPYVYYKKNYTKILHKYFSNLNKYYERGLIIHKLDFINPKNSVNPFYLQNMTYYDNKFCTVFKPYIFKFLISIFGNKNTSIIDLSSGWGDRLLGTIAIETNVNMYIGIDPNQKLFSGYYKMIDDLSQHKNKYFLINKPAENVDFHSLPISFCNFIFWSPPFWIQEIYDDKNTKQSTSNFKSYEDFEQNFLLFVINNSTSILEKNGFLILYIGNINYKTFLDGMNNIKNLQFVNNFKIVSDNKTKNYIIYKKY